MERKAHGQASTPPPRAPLPRLVKRNISYSDLLSGKQPQHQDIMRPPSVQDNGKGVTPTPETHQASGSNSQAPSDNMQQLFMTFMTTQAETMRNMQQLMQNMQIVVQEVSQRRDKDPVPPASVPPVTVKTTSTVDAATSARATNEGTSSMKNTPASTVKKEEEDNSDDSDDEDKVQQAPVNDRRTPEKTVITTEISNKSLKNIDVQQLEDTVLFDVWSNVFRNNMRANRLWGYFDGSYIPSDREELKDVYRGNSYICFSYLMSKMPLAVGSRLTEFENELNSAAAAWHFLKKTYSQVGEQSVYSLQQKMFHIEPKSGESMQDYINRGTYLRTLLALSGEKMSDYKWIRCMDDGLKGRYNTVSDLVAMTPNMTEEQYVSMLKKAAPAPPPQKTHLLLNAITTDTTSEVDLAAVRARRNWNARQCFCCKDFGHSWRSCPNRHKFPEWQVPINTTWRNNNQQVAPGNRQHFNYNNRTSPSRQYNSGPQQHHSRPPLNQYDNRYQARTNAVTIVSNRSSARPTMVSTVPMHFTVADHSPEVATVINLNIVEVAKISVYSVWIADTGADRHITGNPTWFHSFSKLSEPVVCRMSNGTLSPAVGKGVIRFQSQDFPHITFDVHDVLLVPGISANLLSGNKLRTGGAYLHSDQYGWWLETATKQWLAIGTTRGTSDQVVLNITPVPPSVPPANIPATPTVDTYAVNTGTWQTWHHRLAHASPQRLHLLFHGDLATGWKLSAKEQEPACPGCKEAHLSKAPFAPSVSTVSKPLEIVHADLAFYSESYDGQKYMLVLVDHYSRFLWTFALSHKSQVASIIQDWLPYAERSLETHLKVFRSDRGTEFTTSELQDRFKQLGIVFETSVPGNPQQNGIPERMNRTVKEMLTAVLQHMELEPKWWTLALPWLTWVRNVLPARPLPTTDTPYIRATGQKPNLALLKVFGCMCQYMVPSQPKLKSKAQWGIHVGFAHGMKGWKVLDIHTEQFVVTRDCYFYENLSYKQWQQRQQQFSTTPDITISSWPPSVDELSPYDSEAFLLPPDHTASPSIGALFPRNPAADDAVATAPSR